MVFWRLLIFSAFISGGGAIFGLSKIFPNPANLVFSNKCIETLGCFYTGPPFFHPVLRPISLAPSDDIETKFILFTPSIRDEEDIELTRESVRNSSVDPRLPVKVLVHGYRSDMDVDDIRFKMKDALMDYSPYNIIIVDWSENNGPPYPKAVANARVVGAQLSRLLKLIMRNRGIRPEDIHIIGHSLGAQIAGWAGERISGLGRITGLDPAGPYFRNTEKSVCLDDTDALFVDVIHTDGGGNIVDGLGINEAIGHIDFYPNGGFKQPGCENQSGGSNPLRAVINAATQWLSVCDHGRANEYFLESINNSKCRFLAVQCDSYDDFKNGVCLQNSSMFSEMGFHAKKISSISTKSKFFLVTNGTSPFCVEKSIHF